MDAPTLRRGVMRASCFVWLALVAAGCGLAAETSNSLHMVPMRDGVALATEVWLPAGGGKVPAVLLRSVYGRGMGDAAAKAWNAAGIAFVVQDTRGRGDSEGRRDPVFATDGWGALQDGADTVSWIRDQAWSDGNVATVGASALGITQVFMAPATDDVLAQSILVAPSDFYGQCAYQGGVWRKSLAEGWLTAQGSRHKIREWKRHPYDGAYWDAYDAAAQAEEVTAAGLHVGGYWDIFAQGTIDNFVSRQNAGGEGARGRQILVMGPWPHGPAQQTGDLTLPGNFNYDFPALERRLMTHYLLGGDTGLFDEPPVHYYTLGAIGEEGAPGNEWRRAETWPPVEAVERPYYLGPELLLSPAPPAEPGFVSYDYDPADPCPTTGGANLLAGQIAIGPTDQRPLNERDDVLTFMTPPLASPIEITGRLRAELYISSSAPDTDFTAKFLDVYPDGRQILMLDSIQRVKLRQDANAPDPLPPGEIGKVVIDLWSISLIVNKGHRIGVQISSSNYPRFEKNPNSGDDFPAEDNLHVARNTIHFGPDTPSALVLPVRVEAE